METKNISPNRMLVVNMFANFLSLVVTFGISFFLTPYIVETVGVEAYGFVGLANNFISYASLITIALNALAGRFITIGIRDKDMGRANCYYSSVFFANCFISAVLLIAGASIWVKLEYIISIPVHILWDVKILFAALFCNCIISTVGSVFSVATFATNKLYLNSLRSIEANIVRAVVLVGLFVFLAPKVSYLGITSLLAGIYCMAYNVYYMHKLLPGLHLRIESFDFTAVKELVSSGVWSLVTRLGSLLTDGLDLFVTNIFIDATAMGVLSLAKTIPTLISSVVGSLVSVFSPNFTILFAEGKYNELNIAVRQSIKIMSVLANIPIIVLIVCGQRFFVLWQPSQDEKVLQCLSLLTCAGLIFNGGINCIYDIFAVVNKLKVNAIALTLSGVLSTGIVFVLIKTTSLGIFAVAGVSTVIITLKNLLIVVPYGAKCLNMKWYELYPDVFRPVLFVVVGSAICMLATNWLTGGWTNLIISGVITGFLSLGIGYLIILGKDERNHVNNVILTNVRRKK